MACHVVNGLKDLINGNFTLSQLQAALDLSTWTEELDLDEYRTLAELTLQEDRQGIIDYARALLPHYLSLHRFLGEPPTREEWHRRTYGPDKRCLNTALVWGTHIRCGARLLDGQPVILCDNCKARFEREYPQGWYYYPGDLNADGAFLFAVQPA